MKNTLQNFNILCQQIQNSIVLQKKHGFLHKLRPFARNTTYLEQDFMNLWNNSCLDKFKYALQSAKLDKIKYTEIKVPNGQRDIYVGTDRPGIILRYKIDPKDQKYLITQILDKLKNNSTVDDLAPWRGYIQNNITYCENNNKEFHLPMQFQIIARVIPKENQSFQSNKDLEIHEFNHNGFSGNVYLWFDFQKYKDQLKNAINNQTETQQQQLTLEEINDNDSNTNNNEQDENIYLTSKQQDKILLGTISIKIVEKDDSTLNKIVSNLASKGAQELLFSGLYSSFAKLTGTGKYADKSEKPDKIKRHSTIFGYEKPYIKVISTVMLKDWLYNIAEQPERKYLGKDSSKKIATYTLTNSRFDINNIKINGDPRVTNDIAENICWSIGNLSGNEKWNRIAITKKWLQNTNADIDHVISLRFQSWVINDGRYYLEYRFVFNLNGFYNLKNEVTQLKIDLKSLQKLSPTSSIKKDISKLNKEIIEKQIYISSFDIWFENYINDMSKSNITKSLKASADKLLYNSKNQLIAKDTNIDSSLLHLFRKDIAAYNFLTEKIIGNIKNWKCQGESFNQILSNL